MSAQPPDSIDPATAPASASKSITLVAGGDVHWSDGTHGPNVHCAMQAGPKVRVPFGKGWIPHPWVKGWKPLPYYYESLDDLAGRSAAGKAPSLERALWNDRYGMTFASVEEGVDYPFQMLRQVIADDEIAFANLETPLSSRGRRSGFMFRAPGEFAGALKRAGFDVVSTANNHAFDAGEDGLLDTLDHLRGAGLSAIGTGQTLAAARQPAIIERQGIRLAFLAYSQVENSAWSGFALADRSGVMPLDPVLVKQDIQSVRKDVDFVVLSFHWGFEETQEVHPAARRLAREMIDAGADIILGHHPHVASGIEVFHGKVIVYSFGNLVFGHFWPTWMDNYLARFTLSRQRIEKVEILPVAGRQKDLGQPFVLKGGAANALLEDIKERSRRLNTAMQVRDDRGIIVPSSATLSADESDPEWLSFFDLYRFVISKVRARIRWKMRVIMALPLAAAMRWRPRAGQRKSAG